MHYKMHGVYYCLGIGRYYSPAYCQFLAILLESKKDLTVSNRISLSEFDFEFLHWPVNYAWHETQRYYRLLMLDVRLSDFPQSP